MAENLERHSLREWRELRNMTAEQLAFKAGVTLSTVYSAERGRHPPRHATIVKLAAALSTPDEPLLIDQFIWPEKFTRTKEGR